MWFTLKVDADDLDTESIVQLCVSNSGVGTDGLLYLNGAVGTLAQGTLSVNQSGGAVTITIADDATSLLAAASELVYDVKQLVGSNTSVLTGSTSNVLVTPTAALS